MVDLTIATNCIRVMKEYGTYHGERIGRVAKDFSGMVGGYREGEIILFREELDPPIDSTLGEERGIEPKPTGRITIESPLCRAEINKQRARGSGIITMKTMIGVPARYVEEIRI